LWKLFRRLQLKAFFHNQDHQKTQNDGPANDPGALWRCKRRSQTRWTNKHLWWQSNLWTTEAKAIYVDTSPPLIDHYIHCCRTEINRLDFGKQATARNLSKEERDALTSLRNRTDIVIKPADKRGAVVVWDRNLYLKRQQSNCLIHIFYWQIDRDVTETQQWGFTSIVTRPEQQPPSKTLVRRAELVVVRCGLWLNSASSTWKRGNGESKTKESKTKFQTTPATYKHHVTLQRWWTDLGHWRIADFLRWRTGRWRIDWLPPRQVYWGRKYIENETYHDFSIISRLIKLRANRLF